MICVNTGNRTQEPFDTRSGSDPLSQVNRRQSRKVLCNPLGCQFGSSEIRKFGSSKIGIKLIRSSEVVRKFGSSLKLSGSSFGSSLTQAVRKFGSWTGGSLGSYEFHIFLFLIIMIDFDIILYILINKTR